jgi:hypothetical protein
MGQCFGMTPERVPPVTSGSVVDDAQYLDELRALEGELRETPRRVIPYLFKGSGAGLVDAGSSADRRADALDGLEPPSDAVAAHREYIDALRAVAQDARGVAEEGAKGRRALDDLRALPSFQRMVAARQGLLGERSED